MSWVPFIIADSNVVKHLVYLSGGLADTIEVQNGLTELLSITTTLVLPERFLLLRTNILTKVRKGGAIHPKNFTASYNYLIYSN